MKYLQYIFSLYLILYVFIYIFNFTHAVNAFCFYSKLQKKWFISCMVSGFSYIYKTIYLLLVLWNVRIIWYRKKWKKTIVCIVERNFLSWFSWIYTWCVINLDINYTSLILATQRIIYKLLGLFMENLIRLPSVFHSLLY